MKNMRYLMALVILLAMAGWASGTEQLVVMPGGFVSNLAGTGTYAVGYADSFVYDDALNNWVQADILAVASVDGVGTASVTTTVPAMNFATLTENQYKLSVGATGIVTASVIGNDAKAHVTSAGHIQSYAAADTPGTTSPVTTLPTSIYGYATITSEIGKDWSTTIGSGTPANQEGSIIDAPTGEFYADATATGAATYSAEEVDANTPSTTAMIGGNVDGATTIEAQVGSDGAFINGVISAVEPNSVRDFQELLPQSGPVWDPVEDILDHVHGNIGQPVLPVISAIAAGSLATIGDDGISAAGVGNVILVGAQNDGNALVNGNIVDALTYAAGTIDGSATAFAKNQFANDGEDDQGNGYPVRELKAYASKDDALSADVRVLKSFDTAGAVALLATGAVATPHIEAAGTIADTYAGVLRVTPGSAADGSDRAWGESFIGTGQWDSWATRVDSGTPESRAEVSGSLSQNGPQTGLGSGAFLQTKKNGPEFANLLLLQAAAAVGKDDMGTFQTVALTDMGPKAHSLGSSSWDGSGVSANIHDITVDANVNWEHVDEFEPAEISTKIADINAYLWTDGTNDNQFNGIAFSSSAPVFDPAGVGQYTGLQMTYQPSPVQRETSVSITTTQPSP